MDQEGFFGHHVPPDTTFCNLNPFRSGHETIVKDEIYQGFMNISTYCTNSINLINIFMKVLQKSLILPLDISNTLDLKMRQS